MLSRRLTLSARGSARLGFVLVLVLFCVPTFFGLRGWDVRNDEAIYSYAVDRMLETGDWLTPRAIPTDVVFLEKPPLKFWLVAAAIRVGLLPFDELGMRAFDALFGAVAFLYIYAIACRLAGPLAGVVAAFLMFSFDPLLFEHGIRGNNMEATIFLTYCGGMYHFMRWAEGGEAAPRRRHALAVAAFFSLGFMTKFVAALFLPMVGMVALALKPGAIIMVKTAWRDWLVPVAVAAAAILPWFVYQAFHSGPELWATMFGQHVVARFAATLEPSHLRPWHHYFTMSWSELEFAGIRSIVIAGALVLAWRAWIRGEWLARMLFVWWLLPFVLMSFGTSKLFYYAYPFLPPLMIGGGAAAALLVQLIAEHGRAAAVRLGLTSLLAERETSRRSRGWSRALMVVGLLAFIVAAWTFVRGPVSVEIGELQLFRSSSVGRAILIGAVLWWIAGWGSALFRLVGLSLLAFWLPIPGYPYRVERFWSIDHPLKTTRECALAVRAADSRAARGVYEHSGDLHHAYFYYLRRLGPYVPPHAARPDELQRRLTLPGEQTPVLMALAEHTRRVAQSESLPTAIVIGEAVVILFPGPFESCAAPVAKDGARLLPAPSGSARPPGGG